MSMRGSTVRSMRAASAERTPEGPSSV